MQILEYYHGLEEKIRDKQKRYEVLSQISLQKLQERLVIL